MSTPSLKRVFALGQKLVLLVHGRNAGDCAALVVKDLVGDVRRHSKPRHAGYDGPAQIMDTPLRDAGETIESGLGQFEVLKVVAFRVGEDKAIVSRPLPDV